MSTTAIAATEVYRQKVAQAAATGGALSPLATIAFGTGQAPYDIAQTALQAEFARVAAGVTHSGLLVKATATLTGATVGTRVLREVGAFTQDGTLVGRRVVAPKEFDGDTEMDFEITFQY
jgi:hypothetical protein